MSVSRQSVSYGALSQSTPKKKKRKSFFSRIFSRAKSGATDNDASAISVSSTSSHDNWDIISNSDVVTGKKVQLKSSNTFWEGGLGGSIPVAPIDLSLLSECAGDTTFGSVFSNADSAFGLDESDNVENERLEEALLKSYNEEHEQSLRKRSHNSSESTTSTLNPSLYTSTTSTHDSPENPSFHRSTAIEHESPENPRFHRSTASEHGSSHNLSFHRSIASDHGSPQNSSFHRSTLGKHESPENACFHRSTASEHESPHHLSFHRSIASEHGSPEDPSIHRSIASEHASPQNSSFHRSTASERGSPQNSNFDRSTPGKHASPQDSSFHKSTASEHMSPENACFHRSTASEHTSPENACFHRSTASEHGSSEDPRFHRSEPMLKSEPSLWDMFSGPLFVALVIPFMMVFSLLHGLYKALVNVMDIFSNSSKSENKAASDWGWFGSKQPAAPNSTSTPKSALSKTNTGLVKSFQMLFFVLFLPFLLPLLLIKQTKVGQLGAGSRALGISRTSTVPSHSSLHSSNPLVVFLKAMFRGNGASKPAPSSTVRNSGAGSARGRGNIGMRPVRPCKCRCDRCVIQ